MSKIIVENLSLKFRVYHEGATYIKEYFANLLRRKKREVYTDFWALKDVSFVLNEGERVGIIGRNGAGKSTLLRAICGIYEPASGAIHLNGRVAPLLEIGAGFHPEFSGKENIYFNGAILGYAKEELQALEEQIIAFAELEEFIDTPVKYYSTGMYMRLAFSLATSLHPDILILDELFAGGDVDLVRKGKARMSSMVDRSSLMLLVSHDESLLRSLCDRYIWLDHGRIVMDGDVTVLDRYLES